MLTLADIVEQITRIYLDKETWHNTKLDYEEAKKYHEKLIRKGNIHYYEIDGKIIGYFEVWLINASQLNRIKHHQPFSAVTEDVNKGTIGFLANVWIDEESRNNHIARDFYKIWKRKTKHCNLFAGMRNNKDLRIHRNTGGN